MARTSVFADWDRRTGEFLPLAAPLAYDTGDKKPIASATRACTACVPTPLRSFAA